MTKTLMTDGFLTTQMNERECQMDGVFALIVSVIV